MLQQQQPQSQVPSQAYANHVLGPLQIIFSFRVEPPSDFLYVGVCHSVCFLPSGSHVAAMFTYWGLNHWGLQHHNPSEFILGRHMCLLVIVCDPHQECTNWLLLPLPPIGGALCYSSSYPPVILSIYWTIQLGGLAESHLIPLPSLHGGKGSSFPA